ncbi:lipase [Plakobranchus ocellatus]|uniref:Lipase n=1 Tax=Plakobranchus ocellatus TaxID=259542 RepID=A0AAV4DKK9_9GAST|nr:lipase [Plakobranchus ocellatus]
MWLLLLTAIAALSSTVRVSPIPIKVTDQSLKFINEAASRTGYTLQRNPEAHMNTTELISSKGYPVESHKVITEDGYILGVFRIPHGLHNKDVKGPRPVVILQHGLVSSGDDFLVNLANESLGFILADAGADVWIGNSRGNIYSRQHTSLSPNSFEFWNFSWDQMAMYDLPATINYVLNHTHQEQLYYVGHSQGTAIAFAKFSEDQELASHVKHIMAMAPIGRVTHMESPLIRFLLPIATEVELFLEIFGHGEFNIPLPIQRFVAGALCEKWGDLICENFFFLLCGFNAKSFNMSRSDVYLSHDPAGASARTVMQWAQNVKSGQFQRFDFGEKENLAKYGQKTPPIYNPGKVNVPVAIFRGSHDWLADPKDVEWLLPQLNVTLDVNIPFYEHLDMTWAVDAHTLMYKDLVNIVMGK